MSALRALLDVVERFVTLLAVTATAIMMLLTTADAAGRYLLNRPILVAFELTTNYLMVVAVFLAMPFAYRQGANVRVTFLADRLSGISRMVVDHLVQLVSIAYGVALVVATFQQAGHIRDTGTMFTTVDLPLWPGYAAVTLGLVVTVAFMVIDLGEVRRGRSSLFRGG